MPRGHAGGGGRERRQSKVLKVVLLGDGGVGKSSLMNRFVCNRFDAQSFHTIGVEFLTKDVEVDGEQYTMQIWDTAGQERYRSLRTPFYRGTDCCLLTFSLDSQQSLHSLDTWRQEFIDHADVQEPHLFPFVVLGNKADMEHREVSQEQALVWCSRHGDVPYVETSAKDSQRVEEAFLQAVRGLSRMEDLESEQQGRTMQGSTVDLRKVAKSKSCC